MDLPVTPGWTTAADSLVVACPRGTVLAWSPAAEGLFGYSATEADGQQMSTLLGAEDAGHELQDAADDTVYEATRRHRDGSLLQVNVRRRLQRDAAGIVVRVEYSERDVTQLKVARDAKLVAARFGPLLELTPDATLIVNAVGRIVLANSHAADAFGYESTSLIGRPIEALLPERFRTAHARHRGNFSLQPRPRTMGAGLELFGRRSNGQEFPVEISLAPLPTDEGQMVISAVRDISDRKRAERKFRDLLEAAPDAMVIVRDDGRIAMVNSQLERLFGHPRAQLLGHPVELLMPERYRGAHSSHRAGFFGQPRTRSMGAGLQLHGLRQDGSEFPIEISLSPLETEEGLFVSGAIRDATERRHLEQTLQEASRLKSQFLASMSHELRTPLNGIIGFSEFLIDGKAGELNARQKEFLGDVLASGRHLLGLINDVLDLSKIEAGRMDLSPELFDVAAAVEEVCSVASRTVATKTVTLTQAVTGSPTVMLDRHKFMQVLYNLLSNALKFTDDGGYVDVAVSVAPDMLRLSVRDTGIGMRAEDLPRLFAEFQQLESGPARRHQGTGLGLALTRRLVELQGGHIEVHSTHGEGSVFSVRLPLEGNAASGASP